MLLSQSRPEPFDVTRSVMVGGKKVASMHGVGTGTPNASGICMGQPATTNGGSDKGTGTPSIVTRGFGATGIAGPPWAHVTTQDIVNR
jgi:hypothetical protein